MERKDIKLVILHEGKDCAQTGEYACQNVDMETHHGRVKDAVDKMCSDVIRRSMLLVTASPDSNAGLRCRQGPHRTFSPSVSCTALGSAARLALPLD